MNTSLRNSLLACAALLAGACAAARPVPVEPPAPTPVPVEHVILDAGDIDAIARLLRMEDERTLDLPGAERLLDSPQPEVRARVARAAGRIGDRAALPLLLRAATDSIARVRAAAAFGLGRMADSSGATLVALAHAALRDDDAVAAEAVTALARIGVPEARIAIDSLLDDASISPSLRHDALLAAWRLPADSGTMLRIARWVGDADPETRWRAAYALQRRYGPRAVPLLLPALQDADDRVRATAVRALRAPAADSARVRDAAFAAVLAAVDDPHPHVRINALRLLPAYQQPVRTTPLLIRRLDDEDENTAVAAAQTLASVRDPDAATALVRLTSDHRRSDGLRTAALASLARIDSTRAAATALAWTDSTRWILRLHAARALGSGPWDAARDALLRLARDPHHLVSTQALDAVRAIADTTLDMRPLFIERLAAPHPLVRAAAARGLGRRGAAADLDVLLLAYDIARADSTSLAAAAIVDALGRVRASGTPAERSFFVRFPGPPPDTTLRRTILARLGPPPRPWPEPPPRARRSHAFYVDAVERLVAPALAGHPAPRAVISTPHGEIVLRLDAADAPLTVHNFITLIERGFYDASRWHRVVPNFVVQDGDPRGDGSGGPGYRIRDEINSLRYTRGTLGMAHSGPDTGGAQFFITHSAQPHLDGMHTVFGQVVQGLDVVDRVVQEEPILGFRVIR